jgi:hypothetical protein
MLKLSIPEVLPTSPLSFMVSLLRSKAGQGLRDAQGSLIDTKGREIRANAKRKAQKIGKKK